jgi:hypothetical protein
MADSTVQQLQQHVETWRRADFELARVRERELQAVDTREAVRQLFGDNTLVLKRHVCRIPDWWSSKSGLLNCGRRKPVADSRV